MAANLNPVGLPNYGTPITIGDSFSKNWYLYFALLGNNFATGLNVTIATAKLTTGGTNGSMTFTNGLLTAQTPAT